MTSQKFQFVPEKHIGGQLTDPKPEQKFEDAFDPIYECIQNSIDAKKPGEKVVLKIKFKKIYKKDLDFFDDKFASHIKNSLRVRDGSKINEDRIDLLILEDFGTTGITGDPDEPKDQTSSGKINNYFNMNFSFGGNQKLEDYRLGGSEGEGRQTFCLTSALSTFFYYSIDSTNNNKGCFFGISYLGKRDINKQIYLPYAYFGREAKNENVTDSDYKNCFPITEKEEIDKLVQKFKLERKPGQSGLSVVVPFPSENLCEKEILISKIIDVYRVTILRGQLEVHVDGVEINSKTVLDIHLNGLDPRKKTNLKDQQKDIYKTYYKFLDEAEKINEPNLQIQNLGEKNLKKEEIDNFKELIKDFNSNKIIKIRVNFQIKRFDKSQSNMKLKVIEKSTYADFYFQKYPSWANIIERCNDFIRGPMSIHRLRKEMQFFWMFDIQDQEASLFIKNAEKANHSDISSRNKKLERNYKSYTNTVIFLRKFANSLFNILSNQENVKDFEVTQDLFKIESEGGGLRRTDQISEEIEDGDFEEQEVESIFGVSDIIVPPIFESLKYYDKHSTSNNSKLTFQIIGQKYNKEEILKKIEEVENYIAATEKIKRSDYSDQELLRLDTKVNTYQRRLLEYKDFVASGCTFYPRRLEIDAAFDAEGVGNPFRKYRIEDFDFGDENQFKFELIGNVKLDKNNENKITVIASNENFTFKVIGFDGDGQEDVRWRDRSYSIQ